MPGRRVGGGGARRRRDARAAAAVVPHGRHRGDRRLHRRHARGPPSLRWVGYVRWVGWWRGSGRLMGRAIVVIGGGPAGTFAAISAKRQDPDGSVVLLTV